MALVTAASGEVMLSSYAWGPVGRMAAEHLTAYLKSLAKKADEEAA